MESYDTYYYYCTVEDLYIKEEVAVGSPSPTMCKNNANHVITKIVVNKGIDHEKIANVGINTHTQIDTHINNTNNPHYVSLDQISPLTTKGDLITQNSSITVRLAVGNDGMVPIANSTQDCGIVWGFPLLWWVIRDQKSNGSNGGTFSANSWVKRDLNELNVNSGSDVSLGTNEFTLVSGKYNIKIDAPAFNVGSHQCRLYNATDASVVEYGLSAYSKNSPHSSQTSSVLNTQITIEESKTFWIEHYCSNTNTNDGLGRACGFGQVEIYTQVIISKLL